MEQDPMYILRLHDLAKTHAIPVEFVILEDVNSDSFPISFDQTVSADNYADLILTGYGITPPLFNYSGSSYIIHDLTLYNIRFFLEYDVTIECRRLYIEHNQTKPLEGSANFNIFASEFAAVVYPKIFRADGGLLSPLILQSVHQADYNVIVCGDEYITFRKDLEELVKVERASIGTRFGIMLPYKITILTLLPGEGIRGTHIPGFIFGRTHVGNLSIRFQGGDWNLVRAYTVFAVVYYASSYAASPTDFNLPSNPILISYFFTHQPELLAGKLRTEYYCLNREWGNCFQIYDWDAEPEWLNQRNIRLVSPDTNFDPNVVEVRIRVEQDIDDFYFSWLSYHAFYIIESSDPSQNRTIRIRDSSPRLYALTFRNVHLIFDDKAICDGRSIFFFNTVGFEQRGEHEEIWPLTRFNVQTIFADYVSYKAIRNNLNPSHTLVVQLPTFDNFYLSNESFSYQYQSEEPVNFSCPVILHTEQIGEINISLMIEGENLTNTRILNLSAVSTDLYIQEAHFNAIEDDDSPKVDMAADSTISAITFTLLGPGWESVNQSTIAYVQADGVRPPITVICPTNITGIRDLCGTLDGESNIIAGMQFENPFAPSRDPTAPEPQLPPPDYPDMTPGPTPPDNLASDLPMIIGIACGAAVVILVVVVVVLVIRKKRKPKPEKKKRTRTTRKNRSLEDNIQV